MIDVLTIFMTVEDIVELQVNPDDVPDAQLKREILTLAYNGATAGDIWDYINTLDDE